MEDKIGFEPDSNQQKKITNLLENNNIIIMTQTS